MFNHRTNLLYNEHVCYIVPEVHCVPPLEWISSTLAFAPVVDLALVEALQQHALESAQRKTANTEGHGIEQAKRSKAPLNATVSSLHVVPCEALYGILPVSKDQCALVLVTKTESAGVFSIGSEAHEVRQVLKMNWFRLPSRISTDSNPSPEQKFTTEDVDTPEDTLFSEEIERLPAPPSASAPPSSTPLPSVLMEYYQALNDFCESVTSASYLYYSSTLNLAYNPEDILSLCAPASNQNDIRTEKEAADKVVNSTARVQNRYIAVGAFQWNHMLLDAFSFPTAPTPLCACEKNRQDRDRPSGPSQTNDHEAVKCTQATCPSHSIARSRHATWRTNMEPASSSSHDLSEARWKSAVLGWAAHRSRGLHTNASSTSLYVPAVIRGFFGVTSQEAHEKGESGEEGVEVGMPSGALTSYVVTRLCCQWAGTRFNRRGLAPGHSGVCGNMAVSSLWVTNTVKENPMEGKNAAAGSGVVGGTQTQHNVKVAVCDLLRGSIPRYWEQRANIRLKPPMQLLSKTMKPPSSALEELSCHVHLARRMLPNMSCMMCVDSTSKGRGEAPLSAAYAEGVQHYAKARKENENDAWPLVVHLQCCVGSYVLKKFMRFGVLRDKLLGLLHGEYVKNGGEEKDWMNFTRWSAPLHSDSTASSSLSSVSSSSDLYNPQTVYFRINCVDCIDRTNIVQSCMVSAILRDMLSYVKTSEEGKYKSHPISAKMVEEEDSKLVRRILMLVRNQGYGISVLYCGTTHHLTSYPIRGTVWPQDGVRIFLNMWLRWFHQCFLDGRKQDAVALLTLQHDPVAWYGKFTDNAIHLGPSQYLFPMNLIKVAILLGAFMGVEAFCGWMDGSSKEASRCFGCRLAFYALTAFYFFVQGGLKKNAGVSLTSRPHFKLHLE